MRHDVLPGTDRPVPNLLTGPETINYLRLDIVTRPDGSEHQRELADALKSLDHLVRTRRIPSVRVGKNRRYLRSALDRFLGESAVTEGSE